MNVLQALRTITGITALILLGTVRLPGQAGVVDPTFNPGTGADNNVLTTLLQPDGRVLIGGAFKSFNGITRSNLARLNLDGSVDLTFDAGLGPGFPPADEENYGVIRSMALDSIGRIITVGHFDRIVRFNPDGSLDNSFSPSGIGRSFDVAIDALGRILICGGLNRIVRVFADGPPDFSFYAGHVYSFDHGIYDLAIRPNGNIVIGGGFDFIADQFRPGIAELDSTGALVPNAFTEEFDNEVDALAIQSDGKVLSGGGDYTQFHGWVTRYDAAGAVDPSFTPPFTDRFVLALAVQSDGKILVGGTFTIVNGLDQPSVVRLNPDGTVDATFNVGTSANGPVADIKIQPDGRILLVGGFTTFNGVPRNGIVRLLGDTPVLNTQRGPRDTIINSWPAAYTNWVLQETKHLKHDKWKNVRTRPVTLNGINYVTEVIHGKGNAGKFYRLAKP